jgi:fructose-1,6-bisphosphatase I
MARYIGSLVGDFHRNLLKGGIYIYPPTRKAKDGKLRLLYECYPLAFVIEQAGGVSSDGTQSILDIQPKTLHQRNIAYLGSKKLVNTLQSNLESFHASMMEQMINIT